MMKYYKLLIENFVGFLIALPVTSLLLGSVYIFFGGKWNNIIILFITISNLFIGNQFLIYLKTRNKKDIDVIFLLLLLIVSFLLFGVNYSPILEIRQDPSIYLYKALNLINYGTVWQPLDSFFELQDAKILSIKDYTAYGAILNGTKFFNNRIQPDFFYGSTFLFAYLGKISTSFFFTSPFVLSTTSMIILYNLIRDRLRPIFALVATILFFVSPGILWYGRTSFSEPFALMLFFALLAVLKTKKESVFYYATLIVISSSFYLVRIDMVVILFICVFFITSKRPLFGLLTLILFILVFILSQDNFIYFERLKHTLPIRYFYPILFVSTLLGFVENRILIIKEIIYSKYFLYFLYFFVIFLALFAFRDNLPFSFQESYIHGRFMRTYNETNMEKIFMIFPDFIIFIGLLFLPCTVYKKILNYNQLLFILPLFFFSTYFVYEINNSPQLYWSIRRYLYIFIPTVYISSIYFMSIQRKFVQRFFIIVLTLAIVNKTSNAFIFPEMKGLDKNVQKFIEALPNEKDLLILYNYKKLKYTFSPIIAVSKYDIVPVNDLTQVNEITKFYKEKKIVYIDEKERKPLSKKINKFVLNYVRTGENYDHLPIDVQKKSYTFFIHFINQENGLLINKNIELESAKKEISKFYTRYLKREPDETGLQQWVDIFLKKKKTLEEIEKSFVLSKEYQGRFINNKEPEIVISILYKDIVNEQITPKVLNKYIDNYNSSNTIDSIFNNRH